MSPMPEFSDDDLSPVENKLSNGDFETKNIKEEKGITDSEQREQINEKQNDKKEIDETTELTLTNGSCAEVGVELTESVSMEAKESSPENGVASIGEKSNSLRRETSTDTISDTVQNNMTYLAHLSTQTCGFPLAIFTKGSLCLPYLSLPYLDLLSDINVRSYVIGATNILFKQKRQLYDILVDIDNNRIECQDMNLRKNLHLTTEDLRFADYVVKHVSEERHEVFLDGVRWEGGDEWIRTQFRIYLLCLLRTSMLPGLCFYLFCCAICNLM